MNKDFMMGAELALRGAGIKDEQTKQQLMAKLTNAQIAKITQEMSQEEQWQKMAQSLIPQPQPDLMGQRTQEVGASGYVPAQVTPPFDPQQALLKMLPFAGPEKGMGAMTALSGQQNQSEMNKERVQSAMELLTEKLKANQAIMDAKLQTQAALKSGGGTEYHPPIQTPQGWAQWNPKTGGWDIIQGPGGKPLMPPVADVDLAEQKRLAALKAEKLMKYPKAQAALTALNTQWDNLDKFINTAINQTGYTTAGAASVFSGVPGTPPADLSETLATVAANVGFDKLQDMRQNSPTGGALGQVSDLENRLLQSVQGSLAQKQSPPQLLNNLQNIKTLLQRLRQEKSEAFRKDFADITQIGSEEIEGISKEPRTPQGKTVIERRKSKSGKILVKYSDGTIGEE